MYAAIDNAADFHSTDDFGLLPADLRANEATGFEPMRQIFDGARMEYYLNATDNYDNFRVMCIEQKVAPAAAEDAVGNVEAMKQIISDTPVSRFLGDAKNFAKHIELFKNETRVWLDEQNFPEESLRIRVERINELATELYDRCRDEDNNGSWTNNGRIPSIQYKENPSAAEYNQILAKRAATLEEINNGGLNIAVPANGQIFLNNGVEGCVGEMQAQMRDVNNQAVSEAECRLYKPDQGYRQTHYARALEGCARRQRFLDARAVFGGSQPQKSGGYQWNYSFDLNRMD